MFCAQQKWVALIFSHLLSNYSNSTTLIVAVIVVVVVVVVGGKHHSKIGDI
jgi:hypothetical protein